MQRLNKILVLIIFFIGACGLKEAPKMAPKVATISPITSLLQEEGGCESSVTPKATEVLNEVEQLYSGLIVTIARYNQTYTNSEGLRSPQTLGTGSFLMATAKKPMVLASEDLLSELDALKVGLEAIFGVSFWSSSNPLSEVDNSDEVVLLTRQLNSLLVKARRLQALSCQREALAERANRDIRPYIKFLEEGPSNRLCEELLSSSSCEMERVLFQRQGRENDFYSHYTKPFKKRMQSFFEFKQKSQWQCHQEGEGSLLVIPIQYDQEFQRRIGGSLSQLNAFVSSRWSGDNFKIKFVPYQKEEHSFKLEVKWSKTHLSYVNDDEPTIIYLSSFLNYEKLLVTFAHELGHVFGFPDCYHEFYERESKKIIYYALDETGTNLMCHLSAQSRVPQDYVEALKKSYCE